MTAIREGFRPILRVARPQTRGFWYREGQKGQFHGQPRRNLEPRKVCRTTRKIGRNLGRGEIPSRPAVKLAFFGPRGYQNPLVWALAVCKMGRNSSQKCPKSDSQNADLGTYFCCAKPQRFEIPDFVFDPKSGQSDPDWGRTIRK